MKPALTAIVAALAFGCASDGPDSKQPAPQAKNEPVQTKPAAKEPKEPTDKAPETVPEHMSAHFARALRIKDAIIAGKLEDVREPAKWLAEHGAPKDVPDAWISHITELRQIAAGVDEAKTVADAADFLGRVAVVCARCHRDVKAKIEVAASPQPEPDTKEMQLHAWATDRLWEGLTLPSSSHWKRGADALLASPLLLKDAEAKDPVALATLKDSAAKARAAEADLDRSAAFAKVVSTCASCHQAQRNKGATR